MNFLTSPVKPASVPCRFVSHDQSQTGISNWNFLIFCKNL